MVFAQQPYDIRCEWGEHGLRHLAARSDAVVIVDVLSFSTSVDIALSREAVVHPYRWRDATAAAYAHSRRAVLADDKRQSTTGYSLSPASLLHIPVGTRLVLPSPNGALLSTLTGRLPTFTGCLRNAKALAAVLRTIGRRISLIPAGERWPDGSLRPAFEDLLGAGAIIRHLPGTRSPEAAAAEATFLHCQHDVGTYLQQCGSGQELINRGCAADVALAAAVEQSDCVPVLRENAYVRYRAAEV
jgi:2-phosphosulfolactate phosphatase